MKFYSYPYYNKTRVVFSHFHLLNTRICNGLLIQINSKDSFFFRFFKYRLNLILGNLRKKKIQLPNNSEHFVGIVKPNKLVLFELDNLRVKHVWIKAKNENWIKEKFLGYPILESYEVEELREKKDLISNCFINHFKTYNSSEDKNVHGDFTHFNILNLDGQINFIDSKPFVGSVLFDYFYFYAYLLQCVNRRKSMNENSKKEYLIELNLFFESFFNRIGDHKLNQYLDIIDLSKCDGVDQYQRSHYFKQFSNLLG